MTHTHDDIRVGTLCLPFIGNGWLMPWGEVVSNPLKAQRLAGITDEQITAALEEKLKVNMARQWPEPKDGEPRLHIKP